MVDSWLPICDPHIKVDDKYHVYKEVKAKQLYVKTKAKKPFIGKCWPGGQCLLRLLE